MPTYENESYRITINGVRKKEDKVTVVMGIENIRNKPIFIRFGCFPSDNVLIDENGEKWEQTDWDSARIWGCSGIHLIDPNKTVMTSVVFEAKGANDGKVFVLNGREKFIGEIRHKTRKTNRLISIHGLKTE